MTDEKTYQSDQEMLRARLRKQADEAVRRSLDFQNKLAAVTTRMIRLEDLIRRIEFDDGRMDAPEPVRRALKREQASIPHLRKRRFRKALPFNGPDDVDHPDDDPDVADEDAYLDAQDRLFNEGVRQCHGE
jgi:hypothetical protein